MSKFRSNFDKWKKENNMHGPKAMNRFVMFIFLERIMNNLHDFTFKGGNLLWFYIKTPRPTVDIDLSTISERDAEKVLNQIRGICYQDNDGLSFSIVNSSIVEAEEKVGLAIQMEFEVNGSRNRFGLDIVLGLATDIKQFKYNETIINASSIENIIVDKFMASATFGGGNTRSKDFDDLYRILVLGEDQLVDNKKLGRLAKLKNVELKLKTSWLTEITMDSWVHHTKSYRNNDLPKSLDEVFLLINENMALRGFIDN